MLFLSCAGSFTNCLGQCDDRETVVVRMCQRVVSEKRWAVVCSCVQVDHEKLAFKDDVPIRTQVCYTVERRRGQGIGRLVRIHHLDHV